MRKAHLSDPQLLNTRLIAFEHYCNWTFFVFKPFKALSSIFEHVLCLSRGLTRPPSRVECCPGFNGFKLRFCQNKQPTGTKNKTRKKLYASNMRRARLSVNKTKRGRDCDRGKGGHAEGACNVFYVFRVRSLPEKFSCFASASTH